MRDYGKLSPRFWTGPTGRAIRASGPECTVVAVYLMSAPTSNMIGLYYLPLPTLAHDTSIPLEGASKALARLRELGFALYDAESETVWVCEMARHQIGDILKQSDKRVKGVARELEQYRKTPFHAAFMERYGVAFCLSDGRGFQGAHKPHRSQEQEQEQEHEQEGEGTRARDARASRAREAAPPSPPPSAAADPDRSGQHAAAQARANAVLADTARGVPSAVAIDEWWSTLAKAGGGRIGAMRASAAIMATAQGVLDQCGVASVASAPTIANYLAACGWAYAGRTFTATNPLTVQFLVRRLGNGDPDPELFFELFGKAKAWRDGQDVRVAS